MALGTWLRESFEPESGRGAPRRVLKKIKLSAQISSLRCRIRNGCRIVSSSPSPVLYHSGISATIPSGHTYLKPDGINEVAKTRKSFDN
jgi:hypothetical protein